MEFSKSNSLLKRKQSSYSKCEVSIWGKTNIVTEQLPGYIFCSPQFDYRDQSRFQINPRQLQTYLCGRVLFPIPMSNINLTEKQKKILDSFQTHVKIGNILISRNAISKICEHYKKENSSKTKSHLLKKMFGRKSANNLALFRKISEELQITYDV